MQKIYEQAAHLINQADAVLITAGAGIGVDSGLPDFRGDEGFWREYPPIAKLGLSFEQIANPRWFDRNPSLAWAFYGHRYNLYKQTKPHQGFEILHKICKKKHNNYFIVTSNVDGHFQKAGFDSSRIVEVHGSINLLQCTQPCLPELWEPTFDKIEMNKDTFEALEPFPTCPKCGKLARPNILMFGDWSWVSANTDEQNRNFSRWLRDVEEQSIVIIELGAGVSVATIRFTSEKIAEEYGADLIRINPRDSFVPAGHLSIAANSLEAMQEIDKFLD